MSKSRIEIKNEADVAQIKITGYISTWANDSQSFTSTVDSLIRNGIKKAHLYINSKGGTMIDAFEIGNQLKRFDHVTCKLGAIVASSATFLTTYANEVKASRNTIYMIHMPEMGTVINKPEDADRAKQAYQVFLDNLINDYVKKTGQTKEQIEAWLRAETWMNAKTALERKFIDSIDEEDDSDLPDVQDIVNTFKNAPFTIVNSLLQSGQQPQPTEDKLHTMNKDQLKKLGLPEDATEAQINAALDKVVAQAASAETLRTENLVKLGAQKGLPKEAVNAMIAGSPETVETILNGMPDVAAGAAAETTNAAPNGERLKDVLQNLPATGTKNEGPKTFSDLEKQGEAAVRAFAKANPKDYAALFNQGKPERMHVTEEEVKKDFN